MEDERISEQARRRAAQYARQPSLWSAPTPATNQSSVTPPPTRPLRTAVTAAVLLGGPPWLLWTAFGNPVAVWSAWWGTSPFTPATTAPTASGMRVVLIWAGWVAWVVLATLLVGSVAGVLRGRRLPRWHLPMPLHRLVGLGGTAAVVVVTPATAAIAAPAAYAPPVPDLARGVVPPKPSPPVALPAPGRETAGDLETVGGRSTLITVSVGLDRYEVRVRRGDTLSQLAETWLDDADRWPEICALNMHRHFTGGRTLTDCDLIYPGWNLRLPADAVPPADARPRQPHRKPPHSSAPPEQAPPSQDPTAAPRSPGVADSTRSATPSVEFPDDTVTHEPAGEDLILPGGSVIPWTLATAITATATLVWLQRRRRYRPGTDEDLPELPVTVVAAQRHTRHASPPAPTEPAQSHQLPSGGVGLLGSGADAAARGLIITALTVGTPTDPHQRAEVIIDRQTLTALIGDTPIGGWSRLHITADLDQALTLLDTHLLKRARILDEHDLADVGALRDTAPSEQALPPLLLLTNTEQATASNRARITFGLTEGLDITTVVLGYWPHGPALSVSDDGQAQPEHGGPASATQLAVLNVAATCELLGTAREAHTGEAPAASQPTPAPSSPAADETAGPAEAALQPASSADSAIADIMAPAPTRAQLRVLGKPRIENITKDGRPLRAKALELAVFLAVHPDGTGTREIGEYLEPDARISQADQRVHTNASNLRHVLGRAGTTEPKNAYVIKTAGRYRLDPETVDVDVWTLRDLIRKATIATEPRRRALLTAACELGSASLAEGQDYEWIQPHREKVRRWGTEAHLMLADDLLDNDPQAASHLLDNAIGMDRYNEALYIKAMHARHRLADADGIRTLLRALTKALADLDAEPREDTLELANTLRTSLDSK